MLTVYVTLILATGGDPFFEVLPWALLMAAPAIGSFASAQIQDRRMAKNLMIGSAVGFLLLGLESILTIGPGFVLAAFAATVAAIRLSRADRT